MPFASQGCPSRFPAFNLILDFGCVVAVGNPWSSHCLFTCIDIWLYTLPCYLLPSTPHPSRRANEGARSPYVHHDHGQFFLLLPGLPPWQLDQAGLLEWNSMPSCLKSQTLEPPFPHFIHRFAKKGCKIHSALAGLFSQKLAGGTSSNSFGIIVIHFLAAALSQREITKLGCFSFFYYYKAVWALHRLLNWGVHGWALRRHLNQESGEMCLPF